jgi:hypothetical protein
MVVKYEFVHFPASKNLLSAPERGKVADFICIVVFKTPRESRVLKGRACNFFNFCYKAQKLLNYISQDSSRSSDSKDTKYVNYERLDVKEISVIPCVTERTPYCG